MSGLIGRALEALNVLIKDGAEYPDAHAMVAASFHLTDREADQLQDAYDSQENRP